VTTLTDASYFFFSVAPVRQLLNSDTTAIFIVALMDMYRQARGQVLGFRGTKYTFKSWRG